jgi:hypothetical protein
VHRTSRVYLYLMVLSFVLFAPVQSALAVTYIMGPELQSVYLDQRDPDDNFIDKRGLLVASEQNENTRAVIRFDLGDWLPNSDSITYGGLHLYHYRGGNYAVSRTVDLYSLTSAFDESTATWNSPWTAPGGDYDVAVMASADVPEAWENWVEWDVTEILRNRWSNVAGYGFFLKDPVEDSPPPDGPYVRFRSRRYLDEAPGELPYLTVQIGLPSGDANGDGSVTLGDAIYLLNYLFKGGPVPYPTGVGDANCSSDVNLGDAIYILNYLFKGDSPPGCPGPPE